MVGHEKLNKILSLKVNIVVIASVFWHISLNFSSVYSEWGSPPLSKPPNSYFLSSFMKRPSHASGKLTFLWLAMMFLLFTCFHCQHHTGGNDRGGSEFSPLIEKKFIWVSKAPKVDLAKWWPCSVGNVIQRQGISDIFRGTECVKTYCQSVFPTRCSYSAACLQTLQFQYFCIVFHSVW